MTALFASKSSILVSHPYWSFYRYFLYRSINLHQIYQIEIIIRLYKSALTNCSWNIHGWLWISITCCFLLQGSLQMPEHSWHVDISEHLNEGKSTDSLPSQEALPSWLQTQGKCRRACFLKGYKQFHEKQCYLWLIRVSGSLLNQVLSQGFVSANI